MIRGIQIIRPGIGILEVGDVVELTQGDILQVEIGFNYLAYQDVAIHLHGFIGDAADGRQEVPLTAVSEYTPIIAYVSIPTSAGFLGIGKTPPGTYSLLVQIDESPSHSDEIPNCIVVTEKAGIFDMIGQIMPLIMMMMVMAMIIPLTRSGNGGTEGTESATLTQNKRRRLR